MRLLVCWELGSGLGHVRPLAALIRELKSRGHLVMFAARDVVSANAVLYDTSVPVIAAPVSVRSAPRLPPSESYPEVLLRVGYQDADIVYGLLRAWWDLFDLVRPDGILAEHAPTALLAARGRGIPASVLGTGFTLPPMGRPMPPLPGFKPAQVKRLAASERRVLSVINGALERAGQDPLSYVAELFDTNGSYLRTYPELDHYGERSTSRYWGAFEPRLSRGESPSWPDGEGPSVFVYLHYGYRQFPGLMKQLAELGYPTLVVSPDIPTEIVKRVQAPTMRIVRRPLDLERVAEASPVVFTHSGHGAAADFLRLGTPMVLLPNYVEQTVLAYRLARQGLAVMASPDPAQHRYAPMIDKMLATKRFRERAEAFALRCADIDRKERLESLTTTLVEALGVTS